MSQPIRVHPDNPKLFEFRGRPLVLVTATEHYGAVINRPFRYERYLEDAASKSITLTRLFVLFRELQSAHNPYSTCKPESTDYISPWERTGPGDARDGLPKFDLDRPNPEFYERLHGFLSLASNYGIIVELTLLSNTYGSGIWDLNPLNSANNVSDVETIDWSEYNTERHPKLLARQHDHVRRIVRETNEYDNIIYEICNEPGGGNPGRPENPLPEETDRWQQGIAAVIREAERGLPNQHLVAAQEAFTYEPWEQSATKSFRGCDWIDVVNMHPLPNTTFDGASYDMGRFMSKDLRLKDFRDFCLATYAEPKPLNYDEDNVASRFMSTDGWTVHRKRAWTALMSGAHYDVIDFSIRPYLEAGTQQSNAELRTWMKHLSEFVHSLDLARSRPVPDVLRKAPDHLLPSAFGVSGEDFAVYLVDDREATDDGVGSELAGELVLDLSPGDWDMRVLSPTTGMYSPTVRVEGGQPTAIRLPVFRHDIALRLTRV